MRMYGDIRMTAQRDNTHRTPDARSSCLIMRDPLHGIPGPYENIDKRDLLPCPLPGRCRITLWIVLVQVSDVGHEGIIGVGVREH